MAENKSERTFRCLDLLENLDVTNDDIDNFRKEIKKSVLKFFDLETQEEKMNLIAIHRLTDGQLRGLKIFLINNEYLHTTHETRNAIYNLFQYTGNKRYEKIFEF